MNQIQLKICRPNAADETLEYAEPEILVGRDAGNRIVLNDADVSRVHCAIFQKDGKWRVKDLQSTNGTFVNGVPVKEREIAPGDMIIVGKCRVHLTRLQEIKTQTGEAGRGAPKEDSYKVIQLIEPAAPARPHEARTEARTKSSLQRLTATMAALQRGFHALAPIFADPRRAGRTLTFEALAQQTAQTLAEVYPGAEYVMIEALNPESPLREKLTIVAHPQELADRVEPDVQLRQRVYQDKTPLLAQVKMNLRPDGAPMAVICAPLLLGESCSGLIYAGNGSNLEQFDRLDLELLSLFAQQIAVAFENYHLYLSTGAKLDEFRQAYEREPLFEQQMLNLERIRQLNTIGLHNLNELSASLRRINQSASYLDSETPAAHWTRAEVSQLLKEAGHAAQLCEKLAIYARRGKIHIARFHPTQLITEIIDLTRGLLGETIWVDADLPDQLPLIEYDALLFEQIMINLFLLFRNAMLEGGMLKIQAADFPIGEDFVKQKHALKPGPGIHIRLEATLVLDLESIESTGAGLAPAAETNELRRIRDLLLQNNALLELENTPHSTTVHLYFRQSQ